MCFDDGRSDEVFYFSLPRLVDYLAGRLRFRSSLEEFILGSFRPPAPVLPTRASGAPFLIAGVGCLRF